MNEFKEQSDTIDIPRGTGVDGFITTIAGILKMPRVQYIHIDGNGRIKYARVVRKGEEISHLNPDFSQLQPSFIIRHASLKELPEEKNAAYAITQMFLRAAIDKMYPVAFVSNPLTRLWDWFRDSTGIDLSITPDVLFSVPLILDEGIPPYVLVLCTAFLPNATMIETRTCYKITMPQPYTGE
jgi:hypothetical protein